MEASFASFHNERIETMPRAELADLQEARLMAMLDLACAKAPLIQDTWSRAGVSRRDIKSLADFKAKSPFITKDDMRRFRDEHNDPLAGLRAVDEWEMRGVSSTSGTTGDPTPILRGPRVVQEYTLMREYWHMGVRPGDVQAMFGFTFRYGHLGSMGMDNGFIPMSFNHDPAELPRFFEACKRHAPASVFVLSNPLVAALEETFERTGEDPVAIFRSFKGGCFGGEPLGARQAALLKSWGLEIFDYGNLGDLTGAMECKAHAGMHAWEDIALIECLEPDGDQPVAEGTVGELVVTSLADRHQPLIRYRTDDLVRTTTERCLCGRTHLRFWPIGRKGDLILVGGRRILPAEVQPVVEEVRECRAGLFQIILPAPGATVLRIRAGYDPAHLGRDESLLVKELEERMTAAFGVETRVELVVNQELLKLGPPHKIPRVAKQ